MSNWIVFQSISKEKWLKILMFTVENQEKSESKDYLFAENMQIKI